MIVSNILVFIFGIICGFGYLWIIGVLAGSLFSREALEFFNPFLWTLIEAVVALIFVTFAFMKICKIIKIRMGISVFIYFFLGLCLAISLSVFIF